MKIESNYSAFYSGDVMWEDLMDENDDIITETMNIYNIRSLEDCIKLHTNAYIVSVIEIFDKKIKMQQAKKINVENYQLLII